MNTQNNSEIISGINRLEEKIISGLYEKEVCRSVERFTLKHNGTTEDAEDLFHEGLLVILEKIKNRRLPTDSKLKIFFYHVCRNIWYDKLKERKIHLHYCIDNVEYEDNISVDETLEERKYKLFQRHFNSISKSHQKIIKLKFKGKTTAEIMKATGIGNRDYLHKKICICKQKLFNRIWSDPEYQKIENDIIID